MSDRKNESIAASNMSSSAMDAANVAGTTVLVCTLLLMLLFFASVLHRARSRYREYMLGSTSGAAGGHQLPAPLPPPVISPYPPFPNYDSRKEEKPKEEGPESQKEEDAESLQIHECPSGKVS